jgi:peptidoglycan/LPS O-acetylase OafA/YrhL
MSVELFGSMLVFATLALMGHMRRRWLVYVVLVWVFRDSYYLAFVAGMAMSDCAINSQFRLRLPTFVRVEALVMALILGTFPQLGQNAKLSQNWSALLMPGHEVYWYAHIWGAILLLAAILSLPQVQRGLATRWLRYLGRVSFALYAVHILVIGSVGSACFIWLEPQIGYAFASLVVLAIVTVTSLAAAELLTRYIDEPAIRRSGQLYQRVFGAPASSPRS